MKPCQPAIVYVEIDHAAVPLYDYRSPHFNVARQLGWKCVTVSESGHPRRNEIARDCDLYLAVSELSEDRLLEAVNSLADQFDVRVLFSYPGQVIEGLNIPSMIENTCRMLGLPSPSADSISLCNNKYAMRAELDRVGIPNASSAIVQSEAELTIAAKKIGFPLVMKPIFGAGSALIRKCDNLDELRNHYRRFCSDYTKVDAARDFGGGAVEFETARNEVVQYVPGQTVMLETYLEGVEATIECVVIDGDPIPLLLHEKLIVSFEESTVLEHLLVVPSVSFSEEQIATAMDYCRDCIAAMGLKRSFVHFEFRMTPEGPMVIEINPRVGGFYVHRSLKDVAGIDPYLINLAMLSSEGGSKLEESLRLSAGRSSSAMHTMFVLYPPKAGQIIEISGQLQAAQKIGMRDFQITAHRGEISCEAEENFVAKFWAEVPSVEAALKLYDDVKRDLNVEMKSQASQ